MKIYYDTEFLEDGETIELISIGMVAEDGRELYAVNADMPFRRVIRHDWLRENVVPSLPVAPCLPGHRCSSHGGGHLDTDHPDVRPRAQIARMVEAFILASPEPELWAYYAAYDHVALCQLWGRMVDLPDGVPMFTHDIKQEAARLGNPPLPEQASGEHNALADARHNREMAEYLAGFANGDVHA
ncbi:3'-5' exoribonuclease [Sphaerimonospora mesophila]|uniref:3'-5' exoribonuclease n=1 Tax=Sphaerimonospora mesophila TaxID=37483 RepID=UPI0006E16A9E